MKALLVLEDGTVYEGLAIGAQGHADGELVFNTSMTGYQEMLTDPSYAGQLLVLTYPLTGNYGMDHTVEESSRVQPTGLVIRHYYPPSHPYTEQTLPEWLVERGVVAIAGVDTRAITRRIRSAGMMLATVTTDESPGEALERLRTLVKYDDVDWVQTVSTDEAFVWPDPEEPRHRIALIDGGVKRNIMRSLRERGCAVTSLPCEVDAETVLRLKPDGIVVLPGPGDPRLLDYMSHTLKDLLGRMPLFGICLGHQLIGKAFGADTYKLKFGHRGGNHPVQDLKSGRTYMTAQNHGYALDPEHLRGIEVSHLNLNDETVEGLRHYADPIMSIQYHSEACPGPLDSMYIFDEFLDLVRSTK